MKHTRESLALAVAKSTSIAQVLKRLGLIPAGGNYAHIKALIHRFDLDTSHFLGIRANQGKAHRGGSPKLPPEAIFTVNRRGGMRERPEILRRALVAAGVPEKCSQCGQGTTWKGAALRLHVDHRDGDYLNNKAENLRFLCPNCHSQTDTFCCKNIKT